MIKTVKSTELRPGMYVMLPVSWFKHPFLTSEFIIESRDQIEKIIDHGIEEMRIAGFFLHDIGKVRIDPAIINKPGRLTDDEMNI